MEAGCSTYVSFVQSDGLEPHTWGATSNTSSVLFFVNHHGSTAFEICTNDVEVFLSLRFLYLYTLYVFEHMGGTN